MNFTEIAEQRQSCRKYNKDKTVEQEKLDAILNTVRIAPSACNSQPYHFNVCRETAAEKVAKAVRGPGMNKFAEDVPVFIVISEKPYNTTAGAGAKIKRNDYRSIDIGIAAAYITAEACAQGLGSCILGWFDNDKIKEICDIKEDVRLVIALGYAADDDILRTKKRKDLKELVKEVR